MSITILVDLNSRAELTWAGMAAFWDSFHGGGADTID